MDVIHDNSWADWLHITEKAGTAIPNYVRKYTPLDKEAASELSDSQYADDIHRMFPVDTAPDTWLAAAYFTLNAGEIKKAEYAYIKDRIINAADIHGIKDDVVSIMNKIAEADVQEPDVFAFDNQWVINTPEEVKKASAAFSEYRYKFDNDKRKEVAKNILKRASAFGIIEQLDQPVLSDAGYGVPDKLAVMDEILDRAKVASDPEIAMGLANINLMLHGLNMQGNELDKIAEVVELADELSGIDVAVRKGKRLNINDVLFSKSIDKMAEVLNDAVKLNKYMFSATKLAGLPEHVYLNVLGDQFVADVKSDRGFDTVKLAEAIRKLPKEDRTALEDYIKESFE